MGKTGGQTNPPFSPASPFVAERSKPRFTPGTLLCFSIYHHHQQRLTETLMRHQARTVRFVRSAMNQNGKYQEAEKDIPGAPGRPTNGSDRQKHFEREEFSCFPSSSTPGLVFGAGEPFAMGHIELQ